MTVYSLKPDHIAEYYKFLRDYLIAAAKRSPSDIDPVRAFDMGIKGEATFWMAMDRRAPKGLLVTRIEDWPKGPMCRVLMAGGRDMHLWLEDAMGTIQEHAIANGCKGLVAEGRKGWGRVLGVKPARYVYEKEIA